MRTRLNVCALVIAAAVSFAPMGIAKSKQPVFVDPGFRFEDVDTIYILPSIDLRPKEDQDKDKDAEKHRLLVDWAGSYYLQRQGYSTVPQVEKSGARPSYLHFVKQHEDPAPIRLEVVEDDLKEPSGSWIRTLGTEGARWVLILALEDSSSHLTFGSTSNAIVMGTLFDKQNGKLVWRAVSTGNTGQGGILGLAIKPIMTNYAIESAVIELSSMVGKRGARKK